jgi:hypothetical protein
MAAVHRKINSNIDFAQNFYKSSTIFIPNVA